MATLETHLRGISARRIRKAFRKGEPVEAEYTTINPPPHDISTSMGRYAGLTREDKDLVLEVDWKSALKEGVVISKIPRSTLLTLTKKTLA